MALDVHGPWQGRFSSGWGLGGSIIRIKVDDRLKTGLRRPTVALLITRAGRLGAVEGRLPVKFRAEAVAGQEQQKKVDPSKGVS